MTVKSRIMAIKIVELASNNPGYAEGIGIDAKMLPKDKGKSGQKEGEFLNVKKRTKKSV